MRDAPGWHVRGGCCFRGRLKSAKREQEGKMGERGELPGSLSTDFSSFFLSFFLSFFHSSILLKSGSGSWR